MTESDLEYETARKRFRERPLLFERLTPEQINAAVADGPENVGTREDAERETAQRPE